MSRGSVLPEGMALEGEIRGQGDLVIAGSVEGPVAIDGHLTVEPTGVIRGEVKARAIVLRGTLTGPAVAEETIRLEPGARMVGDARAERVSVVEGALLRGRITMTGAQAARRSTAGQVIAPRSSAGGVAAPAPAPPSPSPASTAGIAPRSSAGVLLAPRERERRRTRADEAEELDARPTGRFVRRGDALVPAEPTEPALRPAEAAPRPAPVEPALRAASAEPALRTAEVRPAEVRPAEARPPRGRPPEPVIPGVGRQRARRKDGGLAS